MEDYEANLIWMIDYIQKQDPKTRILLITPPPCDPIRRSHFPTPNSRPIDRKIEFTKLYRDSCLKIGLDRKGVEVVDTWTVYLTESLECTSATTHDILIDGLHLDKKGNELLGQAILDKIIQVWPELNPMKTQSMIAWHDQLDLKNQPDTFFRFDRANLNPEEMMMRNDINV